jgi:hypothetical protein
VERRITVKQGKHGGPSGARSRDLRIKRPEGQPRLSAGNYDAIRAEVGARNPSVHSDPRSIGKTAAVCSVLHSGPRFVQAECGRPARWVMPHGGHVCSVCRLEYLGHMPGDLFVRVTS